MVFGCGVYAKFKRCLRVWSLRVHDLGGKHVNVGFFMAWSCSGHGSRRDSVRHVLS